MNKELETRKILIVEDSRSAASEVMEGAVRRLIHALKEKFIVTECVHNCCEAFPLVETDMDIDCFLIAGDMDFDHAEETLTAKLLKKIRERRKDVPVFLLADRDQTSRKLSEELMEHADEFAWIFEDSPAFIAGRVESAVRRYRDHLLPPLMKAIWKYNEENHEYSWAAPGHQGGVGFTKSPAGKKFYDFYGENLFRTDTGIERTSIGSLLDHEGAFGESEKFAAKVFGAHESYSVVVGTSGSNRTVMQASLTEKDVALCDRNCHKSIEQGLILTGAVPVYMIPARNRYGIIGPVLRQEMTPEAIASKIGKSPLITDKTAKVRYAVLTNCTYDGLCYNAVKAEEELGRSSDILHFDEAWYAYARFHKIYEDHFAMHGDPAKHKGPTVFATHSTHKLLNALSQASFIHLRHGRAEMDFDRFNQAYMMHATTSPLYAICASNDISAAMMHNCGDSLIREVIAEAVDFRQAAARLHRESRKKGSWFFRIWNADKVLCHKTGKTHEFADAPRELLITDQKCWRMEEGDVWHGFHGLEENWVMLDPIKVSILCPGMGDDGKLQDRGVPATLVSAYLYREGIVPTRTTDFQLMFLFSMGITKGKWGTLLNALLNFKKAYDANIPAADLLPELAEQYPETYGSLRIRDLADRMFRFIAEEKPGEHLNNAFNSLPAQDMCPHKAYSEIVKGHVEFVPSDRLAGRTAANSVIPYPPGIPMVMSGENFGGADGKESPMISYLASLEKWDRMFPGFEHETEGAKKQNGKYCVMCIRK